MASIILNTRDCYLADQQAIELGVSGQVLMENAGESMFQEIIRRYQPCPVYVVCGPGANGGDGYVVARKLSSAGWPVSLSVNGTPSKGSDAALMASKLPKTVMKVPDGIPEDTGLIIDCLFGAGLDRAVTGHFADLIRLINRHASPVVAADLPSGQRGDAKETEGETVEADLTITFAVKKPAHVLEPSRKFCGQVVVVDIGLPDEVLSRISPTALENSPALWPGLPIVPDTNAHKHSRGRLMVGCGGPLQTGAARMAARAGLRMGAGWVQLFGEAAAMRICASHETSIMLQVIADNTLLLDLTDRRRPDCVLLGPAGGVGDRMRQQVLDLLSKKIPTVLDADALTSFSDDPQILFAAMHTETVILPHEAEFLRLFPEFNASFGNKIERVKAAANKAGCTVLLKGPDSVIADGNGQVVVNTHASHWLATLGSGDVLAGMVGGLMAQGGSGMDATCAGVWMHGELGQMLGAGLVAEDLTEAIPKMLQQLQKTK